jgi:cytochrome P450
MTELAPADFDIYEFWAGCRDEAPVMEIDGLGEPMWMITKHELVERALRDPDAFSSSVNAEVMGPVMGTVILGMDGAEHRQYRSLVAHAFRPSALARWEHDLMQPAVDRLLDAIAGSGQTDLVASITSRYPVQVIAGIIGVPAEDADKFHHWALEISLGPDDYPTSTAAGQAMREFLEPIVAARRAQPAGDLISDIVTAEVDGERLSDEHVYGFLRLLLPAGAETTFRVMGSCLYALLTHPDVLARVLDDRELLGPVIEETLRWETSVTLVARKTTCPVEIGDVTIPEGMMVACSTGSANRDEGRYQDPSVWDIDRQGPPHLAFGTGRHQCLGMHLARLELRVGLNAVLDRLPNLRLDCGAEDVTVEGFAFRSPPRLPVRFDPS